MPARSPATRPRLEFRRVGAQHGVEDRTYFVDADGQRWRVVDCVRRDDGTLHPAGLAFGAVRLFAGTGLRRGQHLTYALTPDEPRDLDPRALQRQLTAARMSPKAG